MRTKKKSKSGLGCLLVLGIGCAGLVGLVSACVLLAVLLSGGDDMEARFSGAPDLAASQDFEQVFLDLNIQGVEVIVIPSKGEGGSVIVISMDESRGFTNIAGAGFDGVLEALNSRIQSGNYNIDYLSLVYFGPDGEVLFTMTTDEEALASYTSDEITRREFMGNVSLDVQDILEVIEYYEEAAP